MTTRLPLRPSAQFSCLDGSLRLGSLRIRLGRGGDIVLLQPGRAQLGLLQDGRHYAVCALRLRSVRERCAIACQSYAESKEKRECAKTLKSSAPPLLFPRLKLLALRW
jgi:hypothetical protein